MPRRLAHFSDPRLDAQIGELIKKNKELKKEIKQLEKQVKQLRAMLSELLDISIVGGD
jgi:peptidoglycan hydrolase CwlO-like protein